MIESLIARTKDGDLRWSAETQRSEGWFDACVHTATSGHTRLKLRLCNDALTLTVTVGRFPKEVLTYTDGPLEELYRAVRRQVEARLMGAMAA